MTRPRGSERLEFWEERSIPEPNTGCWLWLGCSDRHGYGKVTILEASMLAHRASYAKNVGPIPSGMFVLHNCDNPPCVNPGHLRLGTHLDNMRDMDMRGRRRPGGHMPPPKGFCGSGHEMAGKNLYLDRRGRRTCVACNTEAVRRYNLRKKLKEAA